MKKKEEYESEIDRFFDEGKEDVLHFFDTENVRHPNWEQKRVNVDIPQWMINSLDRESKRIGVTRQSLIKMWLADKLEKIG
ncbi:CopG antitoxin of type II toxin-antitoxin system [Ekhidna lutea]|uniref:CopG antitoxin of type II toxin-antitoxin system n=1 Tax=Ekhidna lutea TaxID=447679 RepID=A0A239FMN2_EKHLU|nr:CopG family transcriptional regulator [Ekhidna lutea]SNS57194.1 CopG antitoxin of type II toxin-antitoxin system [Ekhidna lutea]